MHAKNKRYLKVQDLLADERLLSLGYIPEYDSELNIFCWHKLLPDGSTIMLEPHWAGPDYARIKRIAPGCMRPISKDLVFPCTWSTARQFLKELEQIHYAWGSPLNGKISQKP